MDVTSEADVARLVDRAQQAFGRLDIMICNAGFGYYGSVEETPGDTMRRMMDVNFMGTFHGARAALPVFRARRARPPDDRVVDRRPARHRADERLQRHEGGAGRVRRSAAHRVCRAATSTSASCFPYRPTPSSSYAMERDFGHSVAGLGSQAVGGRRGARDRAVRAQAVARGLSARHLARPRDHQRRGAGIGRPDGAQVRPAPGRAVTMPFVRIPAGAFAMGSTEGQEDEAPVHTVHVDAFELASCPVTVREYGAFLVRHRARRPEGVGCTRAHARRRCPSLASAGTTPSRIAAGSATRGFRPKRSGNAPPAAGSRGNATRGATPSPNGFPTADVARSPAPGRSRWASRTGTACLGIAANIHEWCADWHARDYYAASPGTESAGPGDREPPRLSRRLVAPRGDHQPVRRAEQARPDVPLHGLWIPHRPKPLASIRRLRSRGRCARPAAVRSSSAAGCATGSCGAPRRTSTSRSTASRPIASRACSSQFGRVNTVGESFTVYKVAGLDVSLPRRESKIGRGHKGFEVSGDPALHDQGSGAAARLHHQRDRVGPAHVAVRGPVERARRHRGRPPARRRPPDVPRGQPARPARRAVRGTLRVRARSGDARRSAGASISTTCRRSAIWGEVEKLLLAADRPSVGFALALDLGVIDKLFPELQGARRLPAGARVASRGGRLGAHAAGRSTRHAARIDGLDRAAADHGDARRRLPRPRQAADHRVRRRPHPIARTRTGGRGAGDRVARSAEHPHDRRLRRSRQRARDRRASPQAGRCSARRRRSATARSAGSRRKSISSCSPSLAKADCDGRGGGFDCSAMDWFLDRARELGVQHAPPEPLVKGRHLLALGVAPGPRVGQILKQIYERQLDGSIENLERGHDARAGTDREDRSVVASRPVANT